MAENVNSVGKIINGQYVEFGNTGGGSSSGGHTIENSAGTALTQRNTMQFKGGLSASDDSTNQKTVVSDEYPEIEYSVWEAMTPQEQAEYPNAIILNAPDSGGGIEVVSTYTKTISTYGDVTLKKYSNGLKTISFSSSTFPATRFDSTNTIPDAYMPILDNLAITGYDIQNNIPRSCMIKPDGTLTIFPSQNQGTGCFISFEYF